MIEVFVRAIHLTVVGAAFWLPAVCIALDLLPRYNHTAQRAQCKLVIAATMGLVLGALTGMLYGRMLWEPSFQRALQAIGSRLPFAIIEFCFSLTLYLVYWASLSAYPRSQKPPYPALSPEAAGQETIPVLAWAQSASEVVARRWRVFRSLLLLVAITNLGYHFPTLLGVIHHVSTLDSIQSLDSAHFRRIAFSPKIVVDSMHFLLSSAIVGSQIAIGLLRSEAVSDRFLRATAAGALLATCAQWLSGMAAFLWLSRAAQIELLSRPGVVGLSIIIATVWLFAATQLGLVVRPRSAKWYFGSSCLLGLILIQMSWIRCG